MEVTGYKPGNPNAPKPNGGAKLAVGERLSPCGKFAINGQGNWRELPVGEQVAMEPEFVSVGPDGKPMAR